MKEDTTIPFRNPAYRDELSELVREGAQRIIHQAVEAELGAFLAELAADHDAQGRRAVVRSMNQSSGHAFGFIPNHCPNLCSASMLTTMDIVVVPRNGYLVV